MRLIREDYEKDIESVEKKFTEKLLEFGLNVLIIHIKRFKRP